MLGQEAVAAIEPVVTLPALPVLPEQEEVPEVPEATVPLPLEPELLAKDWTVELQEAVSRAEAVVEECGMSGEATQEEAAPAASSNFGSLEDLKRSLDLGHVVLVKGPWLALAMQPFSLGHADLPRRPELPPEAIWTQMDQLDETSAPQRLMVISHCFAEDDQEAATSLAALLRHVAFEDVGIFFDCCSLYQEPRSDEEDLLFQKGLRDSCAWYASPFTTKWLLGSIDDTRGWRLWERCMAQLMILRSSKKVFQVVEMLGPNDDLEQCHIMVTPQVTPDVFDVLVEEKRTFGLHDAAMAKAFYREAYFSIVSSLQWMDCSQNSWDDFHMLQLAEVLIHCNALVKLILAENRISDFGLETLTRRLPKTLEILDLSQNSFGDDGLEEFSGHLPPRLRQLCLNSNQFGAQGLEALLKGLSHCEHLSSLSLARVPLGGACLPNFASLQALRHLCLNEAHLGCEGMLQLSLPKSLEELLLDDNALGDAGLRLLVPKLPLQLKLLSLSENGLRDSGLRALQPLRQLRTLRVNSNHLTPKALADLRVAISTEILALKQRPP